MKHFTWIVLIFSLILLAAFAAGDWGFYGHREIHYYAVTAMPVPVNQFFKEHVDYLREHAVGPDQRRYAIPDEGARHFIDLDLWFREDTLALTWDYTTDRILFGAWAWQGKEYHRPVEKISIKGDRVYFGGEDSFGVDLYALRQEVRKVPQEGKDSISRFLYPERAEAGHLMFSDTFSRYGILPYHFTDHYGRLVKAMESGEVAHILRLCADIGHYIADAHVPLHTTVNYNGQLTGQTGLHAFWESRLPELFAEDHFSAWVGPAEYISEPEKFIWEVVLHSHSLVPEVLAREREAKMNVENNQHYCMEERGNQLVRTQCPVLAREYLRLMKGMVEQQWASSIHAVASVWYSAWIDAGEPVLWTQTDLSSKEGWWKRFQIWIKRGR